MLHQSSKKERLSARITAAAGESWPLLCHPFGISAGTKGRDRISRISLLHPSLREQRAYIRLVGSLKDTISAQHISLFLSLTQRGSIYQQRLRVGSLDVQHALNHSLNLRLDIVGLVNHVRDTSSI